MPLANHEKKRNILLRILPNAMLAIVYLTDFLLRTIDDVFPCQFCARFRGSVFSYFAIIGT